MNTTLDVWCDFCTHAQALALMVLVPVLLYTWHTEMVIGHPCTPESETKGVRSTDTPHRDVGKGSPNVRTLRPAAMTESRHSGADELEGWAA